MLCTFVGMTSSTPDSKLFNLITSGAQLGGEGGRPPLPFLENQKKCPGFAKKDPDCCHP